MCLGKVKEGAGPLLDGVVYVMQVVHVVVFCLC